MQCPDCEFAAKGPASLAAHSRRMHPQVADGPNMTAIKVTLGELRRMGRVEKVDEARVQALLSMAEALDLNPFNSQMWREYREAIGGLIADDGDAGSSALDSLLDELSTPVRDKA
jgi:hypothetical protein